MYCVISLRVSPVYVKYVSTAIQYIDFPQKISSQRNQDFRCPRWSFYIDIPTFLCCLMYCVISLRVSPLYATYVSVAIHYIYFPQKKQFPKKPGFPLSALIILHWYPYVSLFPDLLCNIASSVTALRKIRFDGYTLHRFSTKNQFPNKPGFPLSALIILHWYPFVSLFPDVLCNIASSVTGLRIIRFNGYRLHRFSTKNQFPKKPGFPLSALIILHWYPYVSLFPDVLCNIASSVTALRKIRFSGYTLHRFSTKNQFPKKPGFPLSVFIILDWCNVALLFKTEGGKIESWSIKFSCSWESQSLLTSTTCRNRKKLTS